MHARHLPILLFCALLTVAFDAIAVDSPVVYKGEDSSIELTVVGTYRAGVYDKNAAEISAYDPTTKRLFVTNDAQDTLDVLDVSKPTEPALLFQIDVSNVTITLPANGPKVLGSPNSVAVSNGLVAVAIEARDVDAENTKTNPGAVGLLNTNIPAPQDSNTKLSLDDIALEVVQVGVTPDMVTFTPDGQRILAANEGEPNEEYTIDPEGSISIIELPNDIQDLDQGHVIKADFKAFNDADLDPRIRIFGPGATVAQDVEPEYIAVSKDSQTAWITLQENNALAILDIEAGEIRNILPLGVKDFSAPSGDDCAPGEDRFLCDDSRGNQLDASNEDGSINIRNWPVFGLFQPDAIAAYQAEDGQTYLVTVNEGDERDYDGFDEDARVGDLALDANAFPDYDTEALQDSTNLGRLRVTNQDGVTDSQCLEEGAQTPCEYKELFTFGGRSFSIWSSNAQLKFDSGDDFEQITATALSADRDIADASNSNFNATNDDNGFDGRSDDKGPEPEGVTVGTIDGRSYAFMVLERVSGVMVYDVTDPKDPRFELYFNNRSFAVEPDEACKEEDGGVPLSAECTSLGDLGPESALFIPEVEAPKSPNPGKPGETDSAPLLSVTNETSGTTTLYRIDLIRR